MEALAEDAATQFDRLGLMPSYDPQTNNFETEFGVPVRHVIDKRIAARSNNKEESDKFDLFTGIIDGVTGEPLYGIRHYTLTGEIYEGKFRSGGLRHGDSAIVKFIHIPPPPEVIPSELGELAGVESSLTNLSFERANFFGEYHIDEPRHGLLVTDAYTYRGSFQNGRFHGLDGELIHSNGYRYVGEFQNGLFHGMGREIDPASGEYQGEFRNGMRHGMGTFKGNPQRKQQQDEGSNDDDNDDDDTETTNDTTTQEMVQHSGVPVKLPSCHTYSGYFHGNMRQGEGTEWSTDGKVYTGNFLANRRHGHGSLKVLQTGVTYECNWRAGEAVDGNGWRILYPNDDSYCGHVVDFLPDGYGIFRESTGDVYSGDWRKGKRHGNGIHSHRSGVEFAGEWKDGEMISRKRLEETDGTLGEIADTLRIDRNQDTSNNNNKQLAFLKQAMAKSIETSLQIIAQNNEMFGAFAKDTPSTGKKQEELNEIERARRQDGKAELHSYANGDTYLGALDEKTLQRTGYGVYVSKSTGCTYTGQFRRNLRHGYGILIHSQFGKYAGDFRHDKKHGLGTLILSDASSYHGGFAHGAFDGKGTLCERNGSVYVGEWKAGLRNGEGMETSVDGQVYKGFFKNGKRQGSGTFLEKSGKLIYSGPWRDGMYHGEGIFRHRNGARWEGVFVNGVQHGYGVMTDPTDGAVWKGIWSNGRPLSGKWRIHYSDGGVYSGQAKVVESTEPQLVATPDGFGTFQYPNGDCYAGTFESGLRSGQGTCQFASGEVWNGAWSNDHLDKEGSGVLTLCDGTTHEFNPNTLSQFLNRRGIDPNLQTIMARITFPR